MIPVPLVYVDIKSKMPCPRACILYMVYMVIRTDSRTALCSAARPPELSASASLCAVFRQDGDGYMLTLLLCCSSSVTMSRLPEFPPAPCSQHCTIIGL